MTVLDLHPVIAGMVTAQPILPGTVIDLTPRPSVPKVWRGDGRARTRCVECGGPLVQPPPCQPGRPAVRCEGCVPPAMRARRALSKYRGGPGRQP